MASIQTDVLGIILSALFKFFFIVITVSCIEKTLGEICIASLEFYHGQGVPTTVLSKILNSAQQKPQHQTMCPISYYLRVVRGSFSIND